VPHHMTLTITLPKHGNAMPTRNLMILAAPHPDVRPLARGAILCR
jgi:hypothetical protein